MPSHNIQVILLPMESSYINLKMITNIIPIKDIYESFFNRIKPLLKILSSCSRREHTEPYKREFIIIIANKFGYILLKHIQQKK
jgi:hypothetical protein